MIHICIRLSPDLNNCKNTLINLNPITFVKEEGNQVSKFPVYEVPSWEQIYDMLLCQADKICLSGFRADVIVAIARGGLVPARILSDLLGTRSIAVIQIEYYVGVGQRGKEPVLKQFLTTPVGGRKVLLVDDVADSGNSLRVAKDHLSLLGASEAKVATVYVKPSRTFNPDFFEKETDNWIVFPWDINETLKEILKKRAGKASASQEVEKLVAAGLPKQLAEKLQKNLLEK
jgi:uncharacterized protein